MSQNVHVSLFFFHILRYRTGRTTERHRRCVLSSKDGDVWWAITEFSIPWTSKYMLCSLTKQKHVRKPWRLLSIRFKAENTFSSMYFFLDIDPSIKPVALEHYISGRLQTIWTWLITSCKVKWTQTIFWIAPRIKRHSVDELCLFYITPLRC